MTTEPAPPLGHGRYQLSEVLGSGGMATVYKAHDTRLDCKRAIKVLAPGLSERSSVRNRFLSEAQTMAKLHHAHIVTVHDVDQEGDRIYMVMEMVGGGSLMDHLRTQGPMPPRLAASLMQPVLSGLALAHQRGVIHRDIKPHNVLLTENGVPKLTDFGIAHVRGSSLSNTKTGTMMGTLAYMAPEQRSSARRVDARSDIYSAGATLFTLVTCKEPHDIFAAEIQDELLSEVPEELARVIRRATRYKQEDRYQSARDMLLALRQACATLPETTVRWAGIDPSALVGATSLSETSLPPLPVSVYAEGAAAAKAPEPPDSVTFDSAALSSPGTHLEKPESTSETMIPMELARKVAEELDSETEEPTTQRIDGTLASNTGLDEESTGYDGRQLAPAAIVLLSMAGVALGVILVLGVLLFWASRGPEGGDVAVEPPPVNIEAPARERAPSADNAKGAAMPGQGAAADEPAEAEPPERDNKAAEPAPPPAKRPEPVPVTKTSQPPPEEPAEAQAPVAVTPGSLGVNSIPWSMVRVDGGNARKTGGFTKLAPGSHTVELTTQDGRKKVFQVEIGEGERRVICWDFNKSTECLR